MQLHLKIQFYLKLTVISLSCDNHDNEYLSLIFSPDFFKSVFRLGMFEEMGKGKVFICIAAFIYRLVLYFGSTN